jgi:hypothetical protein
MQTLLLITFLLQIASRMISPAFSGDWVRVAVDASGKKMGTITWRIIIDENHLTIAQSLQCQGKQIKSPQGTTYNLDGSHIENPEPMPESWMNVDLWRSRWLKIKNANEVELTIVTRVNVEVETLTLSKDALKVVCQIRNKDGIPINAPAETVYSFRRVANR